MPSATTFHSANSSSQSPVDMVISSHLLMSGKQAQLEADQQCVSGLTARTLPMVPILSDNLNDEGTEPETGMKDQKALKSNGHSDDRVMSSKSMLYSKYNQSVYKYASQVFTALQHEPRDDGTFESTQKRKLFKSQSRIIPTIEYNSEAEQKLTYELSYSTLKYQFVIEDLLDDVAFFIKYPELIDQSALVTTVMNDYLQRKFVHRESLPEEAKHDDVSEVESCIVESKIRLDAALARRRIKESARSVEELLPTNIKKKERMSRKTLTYAWVNHHKTTVDDVLSDLQTSGYEPLPESSRHVTDRYFCMDNLFNDTLVFATEQATELSNHWLVQEGHLVIQDKTSLFGPQSVLALLNSSEDVIVIDYNSGATSAHLSSLMKHAEKSGSIYVFGVRSLAHHAEMKQRMENLFANNIRIIDGTPDSVELDDNRFRDVKVILIHGTCSKSAVLDPVNFVITEGEDVSLLQDLSMGDIPVSRVNQMISRNLADFRYCLKFPKVQAAVYVTRSNLDAENEKVVNKALEHYNSAENRKYPFRITPAMFNFDLKLAKVTGNDKFYRHPPSEQANGCFLAIISKQIEDVRENARSVLQRATATGLLNDSGDEVKTEMADVSRSSSKTSTKSKKSKSQRRRSSGTSVKRKPKSAKSIAFGSSMAQSYSKKSLT